MSAVQPWMVVVGTLAGMAVGGGGASAGWGGHLQRARRLSDRRESARRVRNEQTTQARRQIERQQMELGELRMVAERLRRKAAQAAASGESVDGPESILPLEAGAPVSGPAPLAGFRPIEKPRAPAPTVASVDAALERQERARERAAEGGFARTEIQDDDGPHSRGFMPTQLDKPF